MNNSSSYDVVILGAGPAGMSAALALQANGLRVAVFDEQKQPGGQIYRNAIDSKLPATVAGDKTKRQGVDLISRFMEAEVDYFPETFVWYVEQPSLIVVQHHGQVYKTSYRYLIVATGAQERPVAFPGWQLPGVMGVGAAQILLKDAASIPSVAPVLFGSGPLVYLYAAQLISLGMKPAAILDTAVRKNHWRSFKYLPSAVLASGYLFEGLSLLRRIRKARVPVYRGVINLRAFGSNSIERVEFKSEAQVQTLDTGLLLSHHGVIPETRLLQSLSVNCSWDNSGQCWRPVTTKWGECSLSRVYSVGDGAGIGGAVSASISGSIAALDILHQSDVLSVGERDKQSKPLFNALKKDLRIRPFLELKYRVSDSLMLPAPDTIVCRCERVAAHEITEAIEHGCKGPNQLKAFTRCGMGACQGRMCGPTAEAMIAQHASLSRADVGRFRARAPVRPVTLGMIASLHDR